MIKVDYIIVRDINKLSKFHSKSKYINWSMKVIDNEYRFYPPKVVNEDTINIDFDDEYDLNEDNSMFDNLFVSRERLNYPMIGERWDDSYFFSDMDRAQSISKNMSKTINFLKFIPKVKYHSNSSINFDKAQESIIKDENYKLYKVEKNSSISKFINKYKNENIEDQYDFVYTYKVSQNNCNAAKIKKFKKEEIEILNF